MKSHQNQEQIRNYKIFPQTYFQLPKFVVDEQIQAKCYLIIRLKNYQKTKPDLQDSDKQFYDQIIPLVIVGQFVLQIDSQTRQVISGLKCHPSIQFQIIRALVIPPNVGRIQGISFFIPNFTSQSFDSISLFLSQNNSHNNQSDFLCFYQVLQRKYIIQQQFRKIYKIKQRIGKGGSARVYWGQNLQTSKKVAVKMFVNFGNDKQRIFDKKSSPAYQDFLKQHKIMTKLNHKHVIKLYTVYVQNKTIYMLTQYLNGNLYQYLKKYGVPQTKLCKKLLYQLLIGVKYLHHNKIMHRDLKLENIMLRGKDKHNLQIVIIDMGLAYSFQNQLANRRCGTPGYAAPQIFKKGQNYNQSCDIFSLGVIFHIMFTGEGIFPYTEDSKVTQQYNRKCEIDYQFKNQSEQHPNFTEQMKQILKGMLAKQPTERYSLEQIMNHCLFKEQKIYHQAIIPQVIQNMI